jgi:hypothetical protein
MEVSCFYKNEHNTELWAKMNVYPIKSTVCGEYSCDIWSHF